MADTIRYKQNELSGIVMGFCGPAQPNQNAKTPEEYWRPGGKPAALAWRTKARPERFVAWLLAQEGASWLDVTLSRSADSFLGGVTASVPGTPVRGKTFFETKVSREDAAPGAGMFAATDFADIPKSNPSLRDLQEATRRTRELRKQHKLDKLNQEDGEAMVASLFPATGDYDRAVTTGFGPGVNNGEHNYGVGLLFRYSAEVWKSKDGVGKRDALRLEVEIFQPLFATPFFDLEQGLNLRWDRPNTVLALSLRRTGGGPLSGEDAPHGAQVPWSGFGVVHSFSTGGGGRTRGDTGDKPPGTQLFFREVRKSGRLDTAAELPWHAQKDWDSCRPVLEKILNARDNHAINVLLGAPVRAFYRIKTDAETLSYADTIGQLLVGNAPRALVYVKDQIKADLDVVNRQGEAYSNTVHALAKLNPLDIHKIGELHKVGEPRAITIAGPRGTTVRALLEQAGILLPLSEPDLRKDPNLDALDNRLADAPPSLVKLFTSALSAADGATLYAESIKHPLYPGIMMVQSALRAVPRPEAKATDFMIGARFLMRNQQVGESGGDKLTKLFQLGWLPGDTADDNWLSRLWPESAGKAPEAGAELRFLRVTHREKKPPEEAFEFGVGLNVAVTSVGLDLFYEDPEPTKRERSNAMRGGPKTRKRAKAIRAPSPPPVVVEPPKEDGDVELPRPLFRLGRLRVQRASVRLAVGGDFDFQKDAGAAEHQAFVGAALLFDGIGIDSGDPEDEEAPRHRQGLSIGYLYHYKGGATGAHTHRADVQTWYDGARGKTLWLAGPFTPLDLLTGASSSETEVKKNSARDILTNLLRIDRVGVRLNGLVDPRRRKEEGGAVKLALVADVSLNVGTWLSLSALEAQVSLVSPAPLTSFSPELKFGGFEMEGLSLVVNIPTVVQVTGAATYSGETAPRPATKPGEPTPPPVSVGTFTGIAKIKLLDTIGAGALLVLRAEKAGAEGKLPITEFFSNIRAGFGFVYVTGLSVGTAGLRVTGLGGGFGWNYTIRLPERATDVVRIPLVRLLKDSQAGSDARAREIQRRKEAAARAETAGPGDSTTSTTPKKREREDLGGEARELLGLIKTFEDSLVARPGSWCVAFGLTAKLAEMIDCTAMIVVQMQGSDFEAAVLGVAEWHIGRMGGVDGGGDTALGFIQLGLIVRYSSRDKALMLLASLTSESWLLHPGCRLQGGFALCVWFGGEHGGDFVLSLGGYSPLAAKRPHYPALDRVGFTWNVNRDLCLYGNCYLTLDRYGIQAGVAAGLKYVTSHVKVDASLSFDALIEWNPLYYEVRLRISVQVEFRVVTTIRLGLDVDAHVWGPPFGGRVTVEVDLWLVKPSATVNIGSSYETAQAARKTTLPEILKRALAGQASLLKPGVGVEEVDYRGGKGELSGRRQTHGYALKRAARTDGLTVSLDVAVPLTEVLFDDGGKKLQSRGRAEARFDVRGLRRQHAASHLVWSIAVGDAKKSAFAADWSVHAVKKPATEALWCIPADPKRPTAEKPRALIARVEIASPPAKREDVALDDVPAAKLGKVVTPVGAVKTKAKAAAAPVHGESSAAPPTSDRSEALAALKDAGFDLGGCKSTPKFRELGAAPLRPTKRQKEVAR